jgi:hypothetical protein
MGQLVAGCGCCLTVKRPVTSHRTFNVSHFKTSDIWLGLEIIGLWNLSLVHDFCFVLVYVFLGNPKVLVEMMNTMHALQMFDNGEYMVITVDMETYSYREAYKYLWRKCPLHLDVYIRPTVVLIFSSMFLHLFQEHHLNFTVKILC